MWIFEQTWQYMVKWKNIILITVNLVIIYKVIYEHKLISLGYEKQKFSFYYIKPFPHNQFFLFQLLLLIFTSISLILLSEYKPNRVIENEMMWEIFKRIGWLIRYRHKKKRKDSDESYCFLFGWWGTLRIIYKGETDRLYSTRVQVGMMFKPNQQTFDLMLWLWNSYLASEKSILC